MKLGEFIEKYRAEHDLSQRQFALKCGLSNGYISLLEKGINPSTGKPITPTLQQLDKLARGLDTTVSRLIDAVDDIPVELQVVTSECPSALTHREKTLLHKFNKLNNWGQEKTIAYVDDLLRTDVYGASSPFGTKELPLIPEGAALVPGPDGPRYIIRPSKNVRVAENIILPVVRPIPTSENTVPSSDNEDKK